MMGAERKRKGYRLCRIGVVGGKRGCTALLIGVGVQLTYGRSYRGGKCHATSL